jgi:hypothetical protein
MMFITGFKRINQKVSVKFTSEYETFNKHIDERQRHPANSFPKRGTGFLGGPRYYI